MLFIMPALLVIVITLVQENVMELTGQKKTQVLFLDLDDGALGESLTQQLESGHIEIINWHEQQTKGKDIQVAVADGEYQVGIILPQGSSAKLEREVAGFFSSRGDGNSSIAPVPVQLFFDSGIMPSLRSGVTAQLKMGLKTIALETKFQNMEREFAGLVDGLGIQEEMLPFPLEDLSSFIARPIFTMEDSSGNSGAVEGPAYNPVQQNVPAWTLFGMFFTALPIAGAMLQERKSGIWTRLTSLPVSHFTLIFGKILAYVAVCFCQFLLIGLIGVFLFPYIGLPAFSFSEHVVTVMLVVFFSSLSACGYGILLGVVCRTYEQALALGATTIVLAAALGGVMVPVYAMPQMMQRVSVVSPLNWGLTAFHDVLLRGYSITQILGDLGRLSLFFALTIFVSWGLSRKKW